MERDKGMDLDTSQSDAEKERDVIEIGSSSDENEGTEEATVDDDDDGVTKVVMKVDGKEHLNATLLRRLMHICEVDEDVARETLVKYNWDMQAAMDFLLEQSPSPSDDDDEAEESASGTGEKEKPTPALACGQEKQDKPEERGASASSSSKEVEKNVSKPTEVFTTLAPEHFSILSWNLDGLDDKNLEKRTQNVVDIIEKEKYDILFFQELLPHTFDYIARRLIESYHAVLGTEDLNCDYLTATFLRNYRVYYEDHYVMPYPNSKMGRTLLVTKAFIGRAKLALLNSHLESTAEFAKERTAQLKICFDMVSTFDPEYNVIFGGDLNLRDAEVGGNLPNSVKDLWISCGSRETARYTWDLTRNTNKQMPSKFQPRCRFDRLYFRNSNCPGALTPEFFGVAGLERVPQTQSFPSDHWGIYAFIKLSEEARKPMDAKRKKLDQSAT